MRLCALLCWFEEPVEWLAGCVASLPKAGVTDLVAVDGAYMLYPGAMRNPVSAPDQAAVIHEVARECGIATTVYVPSGPWRDNEVEKRSFSFELGRATGADWFLVIDADELVTGSPFDLAKRLEESEAEHAEVKLVQRGDMGGMTPSPRLFKNVPSLRVLDNHYTYVAHEAAVGVGVGRGGALSMLDLVMEHRHREPHSERRKAQKSYYRLRDEVGAEVPPGLRLVTIGAEDEVSPVASPLDTAG